MQSVFNWVKNWYPVAIADDLDPLKPFATKLLGARPSQLSCWPHTAYKGSCDAARSFCLSYEAAVPCCNLGRPCSIWACSMLSSMRLFGKARNV